MHRGININAAQYAIPTLPSPESIAPPFPLEPHALPMYPIRPRTCGPSKITVVPTPPFDFMAAGQKHLSVSPQPPTDRLPLPRLTTLMHPTRHNSYHVNNQICNDNLSNSRAPHPHVQPPSSQHLHQHQQHQLQPHQPHQHQQPLIHAYQHPPQLSRKLSKPCPLNTQHQTACAQPLAYGQPPSRHGPPHAQTQVHAQAHPHNAHVQQQLYPRARRSDAPPGYHQISALAPLQSSMESSLTSSNPPTMPLLPLEPTPFFVGTFTKDAFISACTKYLDSFALCHRDYFPLPTHCQPESVFFSVSKPDISTDQYLRRLVNYTQCSPAAFPVFLIFLDRIATRNPSLRITPHNLHRLVITALTLACKILDDQCFSNVHYAKVGGIPTVGEMNRLELQFLFFAGFELHVVVDEYYTKLQHLQTYLAPQSPRSLFDFGMLDSPISSPLPSVASPPPSVMGQAPPPQNGSHHAALRMFQQESSFGYTPMTSSRPASVAAPAAVLNHERDIRPLQVSDPPEWRPPPWAHHGRDVNVNPVTRHASRYHH